MIRENEEAKRSVFNEWEDCDCNQCEHYWDSSCDGVKKDTKKLCNQFSATRSVVIPEQIKALDNRININSLCLIVIIVLDILEVILRGVF